MLIYKKRSTFLQDFIFIYLDFAMERAVEISTVFLILTFFTLFETKEINARTMAALATMSALGGVLRVPFTLYLAFNLLLLFVQ